MSDAEGFVREIRATGDSFAVLAYADWLEDRGDPLADVLRKCEARTIGWMEVNAMLRGRDSTGDTHNDPRNLMALMDVKTRFWFSANCALRVLPVFERVFPHEDQPRTIIEKLHAYAQARVSFSGIRRLAKKLEDFDGDEADCDPNAMRFIDAAETVARAVVAAAESPLNCPEVAGYAVAQVSLDGEVREGRWQIAHAIKTVSFGSIPLTESERTEYAG